ncbi:MAG: hypothetical protein GY765_17490 [bacterium]|nr:hypothetical protein [bacterium]
MIVLDTVEQLRAFLDSGQPWSEVAVRQLDLTPFTSQLITRDFKGGIFLGCAMENQLVLRILNSGGLSFPRIPGLPYTPFLKELYTGETLFKGFKADQPETYRDTPDWQIYNHFIETGKGNAAGMQESLARRLHDYSVTAALKEYLARFGDIYKVVAVMGGHNLPRGAVNYKKVAEISRGLAREGYLMISGGGPGAMEATHLGVWMAGYDDELLDEAIGILVEAPLYSHKLWLSRAFDVIRRFPPKAFDTAIIESLGIPTWLYGHEPPTPFAARTAKYFANSVREEGLLAIALGGVIYAPGNAGTIQEIFQDACQNRYKSYDIVSPMVFLDSNYWQREKPVYPLLQQLAEGKEYGRLLSISDDAHAIRETILSFEPEQK